ncbi:MAG: hypothetical protein ACYTDT_02625 [Planctomycetota bacterium]|jgi:hypothetical protein
MENQEGSKLMTGYILVCFVLAAGAMIGYKLMNDKRIELADQYTTVGKKYVEIRDYQSKSLFNYYRDAGREERRSRKEERAANTSQILADIAAEVGIKKDAGQWVVKAETGKTDSVNKKIEVKELKIEMDNVSTPQWKYVVEKARVEIGDYAAMQEFKLTRKNTKYGNMNLLSKKDSSDPARWKVTISYKWFVPK